MRRVFFSAVLGLAVLSTTPPSPADSAAAPGAIPAQTLQGRPETLVLYDESTLGNESVEFQRGVFRIAEDGSHVTFLCIPVNGRWKQVGSMHDCGNPPAPERQREIHQFAPDRTILGIRNLGVTGAEWAMAHKLGGAAHPGNLLSRLGEAFSFAIGSSDVRWRLDSRALPAALKTAIPGSGIHVYFGGRFSADRKLPLVTAGGSGVEVETRLAVPVLERSGNARSGITLALDLTVRTVHGKAAAMAVIVSLVNRDAGKREVVRSDGRALFASTFLAPGNSYIQQVTNHERSSAWPGFETFAFRLTRANISRILADANARRRATAAELLDESNPERVQVAGISLRNESRFLDQGDVTIEVIVDYLRMMRSPSPE